MPLSALALVLLAGLIHAAWNIVAKKANGDVRFAFFISLLTTVVWAPVVLVLVLQAPPSWGLAACVCVIASGLIHAVYFLLLLRGYRLADLTVVYPMARGSGPLLSALTALVLFREPVTAAGLAGIAAVVLGVYLIAGGSAIWQQAQDPVLHARTQRGLLYGLLTGSSIAAYTLVDGYAVKALLLSPLLFYYVSCMVQGLALAPLALRDGSHLRKHWRAQWRHALLVGALSPVAYVLVLYALQLAPLSRVAPAREVSMLFAALWGGQLLGEGQRRSRLSGAACMALGVVALSWA